MRLLLIPTLASALCLTGCAGFSRTISSTPGKVSLAGMHGVAHGGQQPIADSTIQLYQAGTGSGYGAGATALLTSPVLTDASGNFSIDSPYSCTSGSQIYITATGGKPSPSVTNNSIALTAGLGLCDNVNANTYVSINEVTTVATVWSLAPFMTGLNVGTPPSNVRGLANSFADIDTLVNVGTGVANSSGSGVTLPTAEIYTIANSIAACINTAGSTSMGCSKLFAAAPNADSTIPADTITAALNIARNPSRNVAAIIDNASADTVFAPTISSAKDLTLAVTYTGGGLKSPSALAEDSSGNIWVVNSTGNSVTEISHTGTLISGSTGYTPYGLNGPSAIAFDLSDHAWITNAGTSTLSELNLSGSNVGSSPFYGGGLSLPTAIAFDVFGNSWISNSGNNSVSEFSPTGAALSGNGFQVSGLNTPVGIAVDPH